MTSREEETGGMSRCGAWPLGLRGVLKTAVGKSPQRRAGCAARWTASPAAALVGLADFWRLGYITNTIGYMTMNIGYIANAIGILGQGVTHA
jgi:hypothetical protein